MSLKTNEVAINKACSVKLDNDLIAIVAFVYHTRNKNDVNDKSFYRTEVRVEKRETFENEIATMKQQDHRLELWKWPNPTWSSEWFIGYDKSNTQLKGAKWLQSKLKKAMSWDAFVDLVKNGTKTLGNGTTRTYANAQYEYEYFEDSDGNSNLSILDPAVLVSHVGKCMWKKSILKREVVSSASVA